MPHVHLLPSRVYDIINHIEVDQTAVFGMLVSQLPRYLLKVILLLQLLKFIPPQVEPCFQDRLSLYTLSVDMRH